MYLAIAGLVLIAILVVVALVMRRRRNAARERLPIPLIVLPDSNPHPISRPNIPRPNRTDAAPPPYAPASHPQATTPSGGNSNSGNAGNSGGSPPAPVRYGGDGGRKVEFATTAESRFAPPTNHANASGNNNNDAYTAVDDLGFDDPQDGRSIRYDLPSDATLAFLPGRLEIVDGPEEGHEIRFVRSGGGDQTEITFGRSEGTPYRHVQLRKQTVSRNHARMTLRGSTWSMTNLSATNPVVVNGQQLNGESTTVVLCDGDRIEMGEVAFRFKER